GGVGRGAGRTGRRAGRVVGPGDDVGYGTAVVLERRGRRTRGGRGQAGPVERDGARRQRLLEHRARDGRRRLRREVAALVRIVELHDQHKLGVVGGEERRERRGVLS